MMFHHEVNAVLRDFSRADNRSKWKVSYNSVKYDPQSIYVDPQFRFYANGNCEKNNGYVSIILMKGFLISLFKTTEKRYFFSVLDASGNKRFTQSIVYIPDKAAPPYRPKVPSGKPIGLERYLKREILFNDPDELLPGDSLTIFVEIDYIPLSSDQNIDRFSSPNALVVLHPSVHGQLQVLQQVDRILLDIKRKFMFEFAFVRDSCDRLCIPLDTFYGRELCSLSGFFQRAYDTPLTEGEVRKVHIPNEELVAFCNILNILFIPHMYLAVASIEDICQLYVIADKYDFQSVTQTCRQLIKAFLRTAEDSGVREHVTQSLNDIFQLAIKYGDSDLKDTVETFLESKESFGTKDKALGEYLKYKIFSDWQCVSRESGLLNSAYRFKLSRIAMPEIEPKFESSYFI